MIFQARSESGLVHEVNQDSIWNAMQGEIGLFVVADGMGGHSRGEAASGLIVELFQAYWNKLINKDTMPSFQQMMEEIEDVIRQSNTEIHEQYNQNDVCGSTVVVLLLYSDCYGILSVGDSRIYATSGWNDFMQLTTDDTWNQTPFAQQNFSKEQMLMHPDNEKLTQAVGVKPTVNVHVQTNKQQRKMRFLLCCDGVYKYCDEKKIRRALRTSTSEKGMQKALDSLFQEVYKNGAGDNVSGILVFGQ